jgi:hypothetical protein
VSSHRTGHRPAAGTGTLTINDADPGPSAHKESH